MQALHALRQRLIASFKHAQGSSADLLAAQARAQAGGAPSAAAGIGTAPVLAEQPELSMLDFATEGFRKVGRGLWWSRLPMQGGSLS